MPGKEQPQLICCLSRSLSSFFAVNFVPLNLFPLCPAVCPRRNKVFQQFIPLHRCSPLVFAINNSVQASTGYSPFFLDMGRNPNTPACLITDQGLSSSPAPAAKDFARRMKSTLAAARDALATAQDRHKRYADAHRRSAPTFVPGDSVWVTRDLFLDQANRRRPKDKLKPRWQGPFPVLDMPSRGSNHPHIRAHPVVHVSKVKLCLESAPDFAGRPHDEPPPTEVYEDGTEEYEAESILNERVRLRAKQALVKRVATRGPNALFTFCFK